MQITHLDAPLGAEVAGVDLSAPVKRADLDAIEAAWRERLVVVFHGQTLTDPQLIAFSSNAQSRIERAIGPGWSRDHASGTTPKQLTRPMRKLQGTATVHPRRARAVPAAEPGVFS